MKKNLTSAVFLAAQMMAFAAGPGKPANAPPRVLTEENAAERLFMGMAHMFTIPNYWDYGNFRPQECGELPGKLFRAKADGTKCPEAFVESGNDKLYPGFGEYSLKDGRLYAA